MQGPLKTLLKLFRRDSQPIEPAPEELVSKPYDIQIITSQHRGKLCDDPDRFGGFCLLKVRLQTFQQGKMVQELECRQWWAKFGSVRAYGEGLWWEPKTGRKKKVVVPR